MSMKKTDLEKHKAKKIDGKMKSGIAPSRFGQGSSNMAEPKPVSSAIKLVPLACRIPADLAARLRDRALGFEGGMSGIVAQALEQWLKTSEAKP
jgi:hypothetical protein